MISEVLFDLHFSLNQLQQSADDWCDGILKYVIKTDEYVDIFFFFSFNFPCNLTRCILGNFDTIFKTQC